MTRINIATHTRSWGYRADRLRRDLAREAGRLVFDLLFGVSTFLVCLGAVVAVPARRRMTRLNVAASCVAVGACYLSFRIVACGASAAWLAALVVSCAAAYVQIVQAFPSDHGWWLLEVREVALEILEKLDGKPPDAE